MKKEDFTRVYNSSVRRKLGMIYEIFNIKRIVEMIISYFCEISSYECI